MSPRCAVTGSLLGLESGCGEQQMRAMVMETGRIVHSGLARKLIDDPEARHACLGL
jgi:ABC-type branched-subunit amino acid transport system ATPase component